ncbi:MAG: Kdo hydroxylase family protein [Gemmataceae bacterium]|nr:Kdo hydroxylase family protein [Gemmataceae bacterium]
MDPIAASLRPVPTDAGDIAARLERGELFTFDSCPFALPDSAEREFLFHQTLDGTEAKHIGYEPRPGRVYGLKARDAAHADRLRQTLGRAGEQALSWLHGFFPAYAGGVDLGHVAFHPEEEATRKLGPLERNDLLHVDVPPPRSEGRRLLRLFVNLHPADPRVWHTSLTLAALLERFGAELGLPTAADAGWWRPVRQGLLRLFHPGRPPASPFEEFMLRLHDFLKRHDNFQERAPRICWQFRPHATWLVFTDGVAHAELRGRFVLEFAFSIAPAKLTCPEASPAAQFERACHVAGNPQAA